MLRYIPRPGRRDLFAIALLIVEVLLFSVLAENFATAENIWSIIRNATDLAIVSIGMTLVIVTGGIDVSVGSVLGVVAILVGRGLQAGWHPAVIVVAAVGLGAALGLMNGLIISYGRITDIIATLGTMNIWRAAVFAWLGGRWITGLPKVFAGLTTGRTWGIPNPLFLITGFYLFFLYLTTFRRFGRQIYAVGNSPEAALLAGINVSRVKIAAYTIMGALTGVGALVYIGRMGSVEITVGLDLAMRSIAAVVIGGTAVTGGRGSLIGTLAGVLFIDTMKNGLVLLGVPSLWDRAIIGVLILASVSADLFFERRAARARQLSRWAGRWSTPVMATEQGQVRGD